VEPERLQKEKKAKNSWQKNTLAEAGRRSWRELRPLARDRRKWNKLVDNNLCS
jgi:hypothetical protein